MLKKTRKKGYKDIKITKKKMKMVRRRVRRGRRNEK